MKKGGRLFPKRKDKEGNWLPDGGWVKWNPDTKKEEFRKYLEKSGVIDALTKDLVGLYEEPERPPNAVEYIKRYLGAPAGVDVEALKSENARLKKENASLQEKVEQAANNMDGKVGD